VPILYYVPIIHSVEDYGLLGPAIKNSFSKKKGVVAFEAFRKEIHRYWLVVEERIKEAIPNARGLIIYHDGFPVGDREKILTLFGYMLKDHPESQNFQLVKKLIGQGAVLEGTEDMNLVMEQLKIYRRAAEASCPDEQAKILAAESTRSNEILKQRDVFIARRIHDTLPESGKGILFIGRAHDVIAELEKLPRKFTVICP